MPPKLKFVEGEKVLCYHGPLIYEAKCLKSTVTKDKQVKYFVHYAGWSKSWDEWVPESRVLKYNDANVAIQREVQKNAPVKGKKAKTKGKTDLSSSKVSDSRASTPVLEAVPESKKTPKTKQTSTPLNSIKVELPATPELPKKKRTKVENIVEPEEEFVSKVEVNIKMPEELKQLLVDDWDVVNKQRKIWTLPASPTVDEILDNYVLHVKNITSSKTETNSSIIEISDGIKEHFNTVLHTQLLYKLERQQYDDLKEEDSDKLNASRVYGGIHLLRLFVRIGDNLAFTVLDENNIQFLIENIHSFLKYLVKNTATVFNLPDGSYTPTQEYYKKVA